MFHDTQLTTAPDMVGLHIAAPRPLEAIASSASATLVLVEQGGATVSAAGQSLFASASTAVLVPAGTACQLGARPGTQVRLVRIRLDRFQHDLPSGISAIASGVLLHELVGAVVALGMRPEQTERNARLFQVLVDHLRPLTGAAALSLAAGTDRRLCRVTRALMENPASGRELTDWAAMAGASSRTLARLFQAETGLSFKSWRQRARILRAIELLRGGASITSAAYDVGYDTPNAFIASFKSTTGQTPTSYLKSCN